jgi:hypothetical protein
VKKWDANPSGFDSLSNFIGERIPETKLVLLTRNRDSNLLAQSNWETVLKYLGGESGENDDGSHDGIEIVRHGHWACGWIEYMLIDSRNAELVKLAESVEEKLSDYPVFDDDDYSQRQFNFAMEYWESLPISQRVRECQDARVSVFAARRNHDLPDRLWERLEREN